MKTYYAAIYGAGLAGCAIANQLLDAGKSVLLMDPVLSGYVAESTSKDMVSQEDRPSVTPAALINPAMGRYAKLSWEAESCYEAVRQRAHDLARFTGTDDLFAETGVLRPAINADLAHNFRGAMDAHEWPEGWISWVDAGEAASRVPMLGPQHGALLLEKGITVYLDRYLQAYRRYLQNKGAVLIPESHTYKRLTGHHASGADQSGSDTVEPRFRVGAHHTEHIIVAAGSGTLDFPEFAEVPLHRVKGQVATFEADHDLNWDVAISAMGYILREGKRGLIAGSTYEHNQNNFHLTEQAYRQIVHKLFTIMPGLSGRIVKTGQWAGIRVTTPNKLPVIGSPREHPGLYIYTAMGSKGLLFSEYVAGILAANMLNGTTLPVDLDVNRYIAPQS